MVAPSGRFCGSVLFCANDPYFHCCMARWWPQGVPSLFNQGRRNPPFDIGSYGEQILDTLSSRTDNAGIVSFSVIVTGRPQIGSCFVRTLKSFWLRHRVKSKTKHFDNTVYCVGYID